MPWSYCRWVFHFPQDSTCSSWAQLGMVVSCFKKQLHILSHGKETVHLSMTQLVSILRIKLFCYIRDLNSHTHALASCTTGWGLLEHIASDNTDTFFDKLLWYGIIINTSITLKEMCILKFHLGRTSRWSTSMISFSWWAGIHSYDE